MIRKNIYSRITESIVNAYHDHNLDTAMEDDGSENMGKKIVAIITADPDEDLDWESEYEPFGATELTDDDEQEAMEHEGMESDHELCPSCGYDVDCEGDECEDEDDMETPMIGGGFDDEAEDDYEDMDVKDILVDILQELKGEDSEDESDDAFETSDENPMFGGESGESEESDESDTETEDEYEDDEDEDEDYDAMLSGDNESDWAADEEASDDEENYDDEEDFEQPIDDMSQEQEEDEVYTFDALDNA